LDGIINIYKEKGYTSFDVVAKLRGILHQKKIGHTGTLDPDAEGVLPVCLGKATKLCELLTEKNKSYEAVIKLGVRTDTMDMTGKVLGTCGYAGDEETVYSVISSFVGEMEQIPPMYSAIKVDGKKLYELARKGITIEREPRKITIHDIEVKEVDLNNGLVRIKTCVSKGTYIRSLCEDIGKKLGCDACMSELLRVKSGPFDIKDSLKLADIEKLVSEDKLMSVVTGIDEVFNLPAVIMKKETDRYVQNGNEISSDMFLEYSDKNNEKAFVKTGEDDICVYLSKGRFAAVYRKKTCDKTADNAVYKVFKMF